MLNQGYNTMDDTGRHVKSIRFLPSPTFSASKQQYCRFLNQLTKLPMICPNITSLRIPDHVLMWNRKEEEDQSNLSLNNLHILQAYTTVLTEVELAFYGPIWPCLTSPHRLQHIKLTWPDGKLCLKHLEEVHQHCSLLEALDISVLQFDTSPITLGFQTNVATKLTHFTLKSQHFISSVEPVFMYAALKYPQLQHLGIQSASPTSTKTDLEEEEEEEEELDIGTILLNRYSAYSSFVRKCLHVNSLALGNILPDQVLLEAISTMGIQLKQISIESVFGLSRSTYDLMMLTIQHAVTSMTLHSLLRVRSATETLLGTLASCRKLAHLDLGKQSDVPVDLVLDQCPQLISLGLYDTMARLNTVDNGDKWVHPSQHVKLHRFSLDKVMFDNSVFDYLARRCPKLTQLTIVNSICSSSNTFVRIHMSLSRLGQVKIDRLFAGRYSRKLEEQITQVALSIIQQRPTELQCERPDFDADITRWYEAGRWGIEPCGYLSICCQAIDRLFVNGIKLI
ncbi:Mitogen-activated protein kinase [Mucor velutinosus]|uniref:Mitogen-activated protein kinase n=1 Tax=Mucor velutinosus TaxID=708070 RepID=A0AAN7DLN3_9FUNG|nr:Mitogen-activated protein kinase [Mucor velutinosus]